MIGETEDCNPSARRYVLHIVEKLLAKIRLIGEWRVEAIDQQNIERTPGGYGREGR